MTGSLFRLCSPLLRGVSVSLTASVLTLALASGSVHAQSLKDAVASALSSNPQVTSADASFRAVKQDLVQAKAGYGPSIDLGLGVGREQTRTDPRKGNIDESLDRNDGSLTLVQKLFDGSATRAEVDRQSGRLTTAEARLLDTREGIALRVSEVYIEILRSQELVKLAKDNIAYHLDVLEKVKLRSRSGVGQKADEQQVLARLALARSTLSAREGRLREAEVAYRRVVGQAPGSLSEPKVDRINLLAGGVIDPAKLAQAIGSATDVAIASNPEVAIAQGEVAASEAQVLAAKSNYQPRVNLEVSATRDRNHDGIPGEVNSEAAMLTLRWNLFRSGADQAQERASVERHLAAKDNLTDARQRVEERVGVALQAKATSEERLAFLQQHVDASAGALESYQSQFELGRRTLLDVLNAKTELFSAQSNFAAGRFDDVFNQLAVEAAKGQLVKNLGIAEAK